MSSQLANNVYEKRESCAICNSHNLSTVLDLGSVPLAGFFPTDRERNSITLFPLQLQMCIDCKLVQTDSVIDPDVLFRDYRYLSSVGLTKYFHNVAKELDEKYVLRGKDILEFGCNDGVLLQPLVSLGANAVGVDPSINVSQIARNKGLNVITKYFNYENFGSVDFHEKYDFIISNNTFAHIIDINSTVKAVSHCLKQNGKFIFEVHYLKKLVDELQWDNIYHEHIYYYSVTTLYKFLERYNLFIVDVEHRDIHSGSIRITAEKKEVPQVHHIYHMPQNVENVMMLEAATICNPSYLTKFQEDVLQHINKFKQEITVAKKKYKRIAGYGASGRANMFCNITKLNKDLIEFIVDESPERCGRFIANTDIPILGVDALKNNDIDLLIIFAWNYAKMIIEKTKFKDYTYLIIFPQIKYFKSHELADLQFNSI
jgi:methylation protein EvaC